MASENFINKCKNGANGNRLGTIIVDGIETPITESNYLKKFSIDSSCYVDGSIIGSIYITKLTGELISVPDNVELIEKTIQTQIGVKFDDTTTEYIEMGKYTIERPNDLKTANKCKITAYNDLINQINSKYINSIDYSSGIITVKDLYIDVCNQLGLIPKTTEFINNDIPINNNPFTNNETNRTVLQSISKVACSFITIDYETNKIDLSWLSDSEEPDYIFTKDDYSTLEGGSIQYGPINNVIIKNSQIDSENVSKPNQESIDLYGEHSITISEDYILYDVDLRTQAIKKIYERLNGFKYVDSKMVCYYGKPFLKIGNKIRIYVTDIEYIDTYVLKHLFTYDGSFESTIESPVLTEQEIKTKQDISLGQALRDTQIKVNKQEGVIESITTNISQITDLAGNVYTIEQTNQLIQNAQTGLTNTFKQSGGNNIFRNTGLWFENAGGAYIGTKTIEWNGDTTGREAMEYMPGMGYYKVSDEVLEFGSTVGGKITFIRGSSVTELNIISNDYQDDNNSCYSLMDEDNTGLVLVCEKYSEEFPISPGTYFMCYFDMDNGVPLEYVSKLTFNAEVEVDPYEFWIGNAKKQSNYEATSRTSIILQKGNFEQDEEVGNGTYTVSFNYKKLIELANTKVIINDAEYELTELEKTEFYTGKKNNDGEYIINPLEVNTNHITIKFVSDTDNALEVWDLMVNKGSEKVVWTQNENETTTDTVNISSGITITSSKDKNTKFKADFDGVRVTNNAGEIKTEFTDKGMTTKEATVENEADIVGILRQRVGNQVWDSFIG